jgi:hypothetical protein
MSVFRPSNINKRLVGTPKTNTGGSPGNGGQIGPTKTPYCSKTLGLTLSLGCRCFGVGSNAGVFRINESFCGRKEQCDVPITDCKGFFICCGPSTAKWFVSPGCTGVFRTWYQRNDAVTLANACMGSLGWFVPSSSQLQNPGFVCYSYWGSGIHPRAWSATQTSGEQGTRVHFFPAPSGGAAGGFNKGSPIGVRAFRCTAT